MRIDALFAAGGDETPLCELALPLDPGAFVDGDGDWEVELGFGKGRYLLERAALHPARRFLGVEVASKFYRICRRRAFRRGLGNVLVVRGEALYLLATVLPAGFAARVHVYFPDPWPKSRHQKRRLFDPETVDLVLGLLRPGGELCFATDFLEYGELVAAILGEVPGLRVEPRAEPWDDGPRTHYEGKYIAEGRAIVRLVAKAQRPLELHPRGRRGILVAPREKKTAEDGACTS